MSSNQTTREQIQATADAANKAAAEAAAKAEQGSGGGALGRGGYGAPRTTGGGPTWADTPAGRELRKAYEDSGVVFNDRGDLIYNPADLGAAEVERARAARGEAPSYKDAGTISPTYAAEVYTHSRRTQQAVRSNVEQVNRQRAEVQSSIKAKQQHIKQLESQQAQVTAMVAGNPSGTGGQLDTIRREINQERQALSNLNARLGSLDAARTSLAKQEQSAMRDVTASALSLGASRTTKGPADTGAFSSSRVMASERVQPASPQRERVKAQTGVKEKLYANPTFMQDASTYTRPELYTDVIRQERPKAVQGIQDKLFINPNYVTREEQRAADQERSIFSISLGATEPQPNTFAISLTEGAPQKPKQITQAEFDAMSPQQQAVYNAEIAAYNKYVSDYNQSQKQAAKQARAQNILQAKQAKSELLLDIANLKKQGVTSLTARTSEGPMDIPINNAFKALISGKVAGATILGVGVAPTIPEGYTLTGLSSQMLVPTKETSERLLREEQRKQIERDPTGLSKFIYKEEQATERGGTVYGPIKPSLVSELARAGSSYYSTLASGVGSFFNLARTGSMEVTRLAGDTKTSLAYALTPTLYQQKPTGFDIAFNAPIVAAFESIQRGNVTEFVPALQKETTLAATTITRAPIGAIVGQGAGFFTLSGAPLPGKGTSKVLSTLSPIKYTKVIVPTEKGAERVASVFTIGYKPETSKYIGGFYGGAEKYKPFVSTPDWGRMGLERVTPPSGGSFDVYEFAAYNKQQSKPIYDLFRYGEKTGAVKPGTIEQQVIENVERQKQMKMKVKYEKTLPVQIEGIPLRESEMTSMQQAISVIQKKGYTEPGKGSLITNMIAGWPKRAQGDLVDLEIKIPKNTDKIMKDVENLRYRAEEAAKKGDYNTQQKLLAKAEKREAKVYEKGEAAVDYILSNVKMEPGRALGRKGFNIVVGEAESEGKSLFRNRPLRKNDFKDIVPGLSPQEQSILSDEGLIYYHGTKSKGQKQNILTKGPRIPEDTGFFLSPKKTGYFSASEFGKELVQVTIKPTAKILKVGDDFLVEGKQIDDILEEEGIEFAKSKGYQGIDRPISVMRGGEGERELILFSKEPIQNISDIPKTTQKLEFHHVVKGEGIKQYGVPLTFEEHKGITALQGQLGKIPHIPGQEKALALLGERGQYTPSLSKSLARLTPKEKAEIRATLLKASEEATKLERPGIKQDTGKEVLNMIGYREKLTDKTAEMLGNIDRPFGEKWPKDTVKFRVKDESGDIVTYKTPYQSMAKFKAISGIQSAESMADDFSHTQEWKDKLLGGARLVKSPKSFRYDKDPLDAYMLTYRNVKYQFDKGDIAGAKESVEAALGMRKYYTGYDFIQGAKKFKDISEVEVPQSPSGSVSGTIQNLSGRAGVGASRVTAPTLVSPTQKQQSPKNKPVASPLQIKSPLTMSTRSGLQTSARSSMLSSRSGSTRMISSYHSTRSVASSPKSAYSPRRSPVSYGVSPTYGVSPKSYGVSPKPSPLSVPSPKSIPSPRYGGSPYGTSPYGTSPMSPVSPSPLSPLSPISPIVPEPLKPLFPPSPPKPFRYRPPFLKNTTDKTKLSKKGQLEFFGSTHAASILGFRSKKKDFDYAKDLSGKAVQDIRKTDPIKRSPLTKKKSGMILSSPKRYFTPTKKQSKNFLKMRL